MLLIFGYDRVYNLHFLKSAWSFRNYDFYCLDANQNVGSKMLITKYLIWKKNHVCGNRISSF